jgi:multiple sugar transport system substrate-binding protein
VVIEKEVIKEVPVEKVVVVEKDVPREVIKEVPVEVEVEKEVERIVTATPKPAEKAEIRFLYWDDFEGTWQSEAYMEIHPEVSVEMIPYLEETGKLDAMIAAGNPPDIFVIGGDDVFKYSSIDALLNFQPLADADPNFDISMYFPEAVAGWQSPDGDLYGLGPDFGMELLYYNKTVLEEAGVPYPDESWTWDDMREASKVLTKGEGPAKQFGSVAFWRTSQQMSLVWQNAGMVYNEDRTACLMDSDEAIEALEYAYSYVEDGLAPAPQEVSALGMDVGPFFATGRVGFTPGGHWYFRYMADMDFDVTALPKQKKAATYLYQAIWSASSATKHPEVCWDLIQFSCSPKWSEMFCTYIGGMSTLVAVARKLAISDPDALLFMAREGGLGSEELPSVQKVFRAMFDAIPGAQRPLLIPGIREIQDSVWTPAADHLWTGDSTPEEVGQEIARGANQILDREWAGT